MIARLLVVLGAALLAATLAYRLASDATAPRADWRPRIVIWLAIDTCRADHLGGYGYRRPTSPNLDRMAAQGVLFENAFSQANESLFSYSAIFTGQYPERQGRLDYNYHLSPNAMTLPRLLQASGLRTAAFVAGGHLSRAFGFGPGFDVYRDDWDFGSLHATFPPAMDWLAALDRRASAFLMIHGYDAHAPYQNALLGETFDPAYHGIADQIITIPEASDNIYQGEYFPRLPTLQFMVSNQVGRRVLDPTLFPALARMQGQGTRLTQPDIDHIIAHYDACLRYADTYVGLLLARIQELGLERETLVVVFGDHGEDLMEHGFFNHRDAVTDSCTHVPLVMWGPGGLPAGRRVGEVVELIDLLPTVLDFCGLAPEKAADGHSLRPLLGDVGSASSGKGAGDRGPLPGGGGEPSGSETAAAFSEGILPMSTVRTQAARLVFNAHSEVPMPPLNPRDYTFYQVEQGRERAAAADGPVAEALRARLLAWQKRLYGR